VRYSLNPKYFRVLILTPHPGPDLEPCREVLGEDGAKRVVEDGLELKHWERVHVEYDTVERGLKVQMLALSLTLTLSLSLNLTLTLKAEMLALSAQGLDGFSRMVDAQTSSNNNDSNNANRRGVNDGRRRLAGIRMLSERLQENLNGIFGLIILRWKDSWKAAGKENLKIEHNRLKIEREGREALERELKALKDGEVASLRSNVLSLEAELKESQRKHGIEKGAAGLKLILRCLHRCLKGASFILIEGWRLNLREDALRLGLEAGRRQALQKVAVWEAARLGKIAEKAGIESDQAEFLKQRVEESLSLAKESLEDLTANNMFMDDGESEVEKAKSVEEEDYAKWSCEMQTENLDAARGRAKVS